MAHGSNRTLHPPQFDGGAVRPRVLALSPQMAMVGLLRELLVERVVDLWGFCTQGSIEWSDGDRQRESRGSEQAGER